VRKAMAVVEPISKEIHARDVMTQAGLAKVSIIGSGMTNQPGYASRMFATLSQAGVNIEMIATSEIRITCIIEEARIKDAVSALHRAFELDKAG